MTASRLAAMPAPVMAGLKPSDRYMPMAGIRQRGSGLVAHVGTIMHVASGPREMGLQANADRFDTPMGCHYNCPNLWIRSISEAF